MYMYKALSSRHIYNELGKEIDCIIDTEIHNYLNRSDLKQSTQINQLDC